jgi:peroxiredoxin
LLSADARQDTRIVAVSVDDRERQQMMIDRVAEEYGVDMTSITLLSDPDHEVIDRYGIFNDAEPRGRPVPHPTTLIIDTDGVIRWRVTEVDYRVRPENEDILAALREVR